MYLSCADYEGEEAVCLLEREGSLDNLNSRYLNEQAIVAAFLFISVVFCIRMDGLVRS